MKKIIVVVLILIVSVGCKADDGNSTTKANSFNPREQVENVLLNDGVDNLKVVKENATQIVFEQNKQCKIDVTLKANKIVKIKTSGLNTDFSNDEEFSCVFRSLIKVDDFNGHDDDKNDAFLIKFRDQNDFVFENIKINKSDYIMSIEALEDK